MSNIELAPTSAVEDHQLVDLVEEITARLQAGEPCEIEAYAARFPEYADRLRDWMTVMSAMADLGHSLAVGAASRAALPTSSKSVMGESPDPAHPADVMRGSPDPAHPASSIQEPARHGESSTSSFGLLGDFHILRELGRGGMGVVYEAEQISLGRRVALKVLPFAAMLDKQQLARFKNEARAAATLDHPNIVAIYSVGVERSVHFYAMQLIEGQSLAQVVEELRKESGRAVEQKSCSGGVESRSNGSTTALPRCRSTALSGADTSPIAHAPTVLAPSSPLPAFASREYFRTIAQLGIQAAEALDHAHQNGILHRDIKPANLLIECSHHAPRDEASNGPQGRKNHHAERDDYTFKLWITDFGLARMEQDAGLTVTGDILGTLRYMSPEQALAKRVVVDHRSDIYSLGITLYELLALQPAFPATDRQELLRQIAFDEPRALRKLDGHIPFDLETIIVKASAKERDERYQSARELADDLGAFCERRPINARPRSLADRARKWLRRHLVLVAVAGAAALLFCSILVVSIVLVNQAESRTALARAEMSALRNWTENALSPQKKAWNEEVPSTQDRNRSASGRVDRWPEAFADSTDFLANPRPNQRWRLVPSGSKDEYLIEWRDPGTQTWSGRVLELAANDGVVLRPSTNSSSQRWRITDGRDPRLFVNISSGLVLDYYGRGERQFQADVSMQVGATGKYGQLWIILVTPNKGEVGLFNVHAKRYLGYDSVANIVSCEE